MNTCATVGRFASLAIAALAALSCTDADPAALDKKTDWLQLCQHSGECGSDLECIYGVCTLRCSSDASCHKLSSYATCIAPPVINDCSEDGGIAVCTLSCTGAENSCKSQQKSLVCVQGACVAESCAPAPTELDAGAESGVAPSSHNAGDAASPDSLPTDAGNQVVMLSGPGQWRSAASMSETRAQHSATLLQNGMVLVAGGIGTAGGTTAHELATAELYDPRTDTWSAAGMLNQARDGHTAILLDDGQVLVAAGLSGGFALDSAELYDPSTNAWSPTGSLTYARTGTATLLSNGNVLFVAGSGNTNENPTEAELYDPATGTWSVTGAVAAPRSGHTATRLANGKVLIAAGTAVGVMGPDVGVAEAELYDPATATWSPAGTMSQVLRSTCTAALLQDGKVLVAGGFTGNPNGTSLSSAELFDPATNSWSRAMSLNQARWAHGATLLPDGRLLVEGGIDEAGAALADAEIYDAAADSWWVTARLHDPRWIHTATLLKDGRVLVAGGWDRTSYLASVELYTPGAGDAPDGGASSSNMPPVDDAGVKDAGVQAPLDAGDAGCDPGIPTVCGTFTCTACPPLVACCLPTMACGTSSGNGVCDPIN